MTDEIQEHTHTSEEIMSLTSEVSEVSEAQEKADGASGKDRSYAKRMLARRRIEQMRDEKALEKQLTCLDWPEESSVQSQ